MSGDGWEQVTVAGYLLVGLSPKTAVTYARAMVKLRPLLEARGVDLGSCSAADIAAAAKAWPWSFSSLVQLKCGLRWAFEITGRDPHPDLRCIRVPKRPRGRCLALSTADARRLADHAQGRGDRQGLAVMFGLYAALRRAEIAAVRWEDVEDDTAGPAWLRVCGKGDVTDWVPIHPTLARVLAEQRPESRRGWLFPGRIEGHLNPETVWEWVREVGAECGVTVRTHILRHTALAEMNDRSGDLRAVQSIARHASPATTAIYTRTTRDRQRAVVGLVAY